MKLKTAIIMATAINFGMALYAQDNRTKEQMAGLFAQRIAEK